MNNKEINNEMENSGALLMSDELASLLDFMENTLAKELPTLTIDLDYFILSIFTQKQSNIYRRLDDHLVTSAMEAIFNSFYQVVSSKALTAIKTNRKVIIDNSLQHVLFKANEEAKALNSNEITSEHVFLAILNDTDENNKIRRVFNKAGLTYGILKNKIQSETLNETLNGTVNEIVQNFGTDSNGKNKIKVRVVTNIPDDNEEAKEMLKKFFEENNINPDDVVSVAEMPEFPPFPGFGTKKKSGKNPNIRSYCTNLNDLAEQGKITPLIGREREINEIIRILGRKKKNNAILLGGEGVGKTAIGESLALKIVNQDVPEFLIGKTLVSLDMTALMAGTTLRGMFEERVKGILDEIKADPSFILFMDNIGAILADKGKNDYEISAMLARALENGDIQVIGTSDFTSYRKTFDKDPSLARRFQKIIVEAPNAEESIEILNGLKPFYEDFHKVSYETDAIEACVTLAERYISERNLPDSAIDILDEIGALKGTIQDSDKVKELRQSIKMSEAIKADKQKDKDYEAVDTIEAELKKLKKQCKTEKEKFKKEQAKNPIVITKSDILDFVSEKTNIPVNNLTADDKKKLIDMNERIKSVVIGQDKAIDTICKALKRNRIGLKKNGCMYSAIAIGKTGVGKCVSGNTNIKIRNKKTGEIQILTINELKKLVSSSSFTNK